MTRNKLTFAVCALMSMSLVSPIAKADDEKGFIVNAWEKFKAKKAVKEAPPAAKPKEPRPIELPRTVEVRSPEKPVPMSSSKMTSYSEDAQSFSYVYTSQGEEEEPAALEEVELIEESAGIVEDESTTKGANEEKKRPELSKEKMIASIERRVKVYPQLLQFIPDLKMKKSQDGTEELYYTDKGGIAIKIRDLEEKSLLNLFGRVNNEATRLNTERIQKQIQQQEQLMRQIQQQQQQVQQQQQMQQNMPVQPVQPVQPPQVYYPPPQPPQQSNVQNPPPQPAQPPRR